jgi:hypothetical protein
MLGSALAWRKFYWLPIVAFPAACSAAQIAVLLVYDAAQPTDDLHCDATAPEW